jgi:hypothetical protein
MSADPDRHEPAGVYFHRHGGLVHDRGIISIARECGSTNGFRGLT